jgi:hypothetical protein
MARKAFYLVARRADNGTHYVLATIRRFTRYSEAEMFTMSIPAAKDPIILMFD